MTAILRIRTGGSLNRLLVSFTDLFFRVVVISEWKYFSHPTFGFREFGIIATVGVCCYHNCCSCRVKIKVDPYNEIKEGMATNSIERVAEANN